MAFIITTMHFKSAAALACLEQRLQGPPLAQSPGRFDPRGPNDWIEATAGLTLAKQPLRPL